MPATGCKLLAVRFKEPFADADQFLERVTSFRDQNFGSCVIDELELVTNDWYQQESKVQLFETFSLQ